MTGYKKGPITTQPKTHPCMACGKPAERKMRDPLERIKGHPWMCSRCYKARRASE